MKTKSYSDLNNKKELLFKKLGESIDVSKRLNN